MIDAPADGTSNQPSEKRKKGPSAIQTKVAAVTPTNAPLEPTIAGARRAKGTDQLLQPPFRETSFEKRLSSPSFVSSW
jgi:hypothetical protein